MGIEKASGDGGAKDGGEVSLEGAREVAPALELQRQRSNYNTALELQGSARTVQQGAREVAPAASRAHVKWLQPQMQLSNAEAALELHSSSRTAEAALELHNSSRTAEAALELYSRAHVKWLQLQAGRT
eukprot:CAMPEP_0173113390 /NCGR_PEP_ID=MMETSP1102-20130122/46824_1 /TAXON_ID=49646 /ORGANISM="Geminigera sp., Strain Caron Lab Isolate" /LENGTH=128 /DNA_ID=CAMNT_0014015121 /DNA_START=390 /DNA_END=778 /DNA_ORIENTATION=+